MARSNAAHARVRRIEKAAKKAAALHLVYSYGGGRGTESPGRMSDPLKHAPGTSWSDCSGLAQWLCQVGDIRLKNYVGSTWSLAEEGEAGTSPHFTLFIKNNPGDEHVVIRLRKRPRPWHNGPKFRWVECGGSDNPSSGGGPSFFRPSEARIAEFPIHRRFPGL